MKEDKPPQEDPRKHFYRRYLPHIQVDDRPIFITFRTANDLLLSPACRDLMAGHLVHDHGKIIHVECYVVMPDHAHLLYIPQRNSQNRRYSLEEVMNPIKGASAHSIIRLLKRKGPVWQDESFDHIVRDYDKFEEKFEYIVNNPAAEGLVDDPRLYKWLWVNGWAK